MTTLKLSRAKWVTSIQDAGSKLGTAPKNIRALIDLGYIKTLKLVDRGEVIPNKELERFMMENLGSDLSEAIKQQLETNNRKKQLA